MFNKKEWRKQWQEKNPTYNRNWKRKWRQENPEKSRQQSYYWYLKNKAILHELKINGCAICGYDKCDRALDFHHVNPKDKKFQITVSRIGNKKLIEEINKCILLCGNCHMEIEDKEVKNA